MKKEYVNSTIEFIVIKENDIITESFGGNQAGYTSKPFDELFS